MELVINSWKAKAYITKIVCHVTWKKSEGAILIVRRDFFGKVKI